MVGKLKPLETHTDKRGSLAEVIRCSQKLLPNIAQINLINDPARGTIRAWHKHYRTWELFLCVNGEVKFVLYDDRENSNTNGEMKEFIFDGENPSILIVAPQIYHGHISLQDDTQLIVVLSREYDKENPDQESLSLDYFDYEW